MEKHEFFVGMWLNGDAGPFQVDEDWLEVLFAVRNYDQMEPVKMSPVILEKCGFINSGPDDHHKGNMWKKDGFGYEFCQDGYFVDNTGYYGEHSDLEQIDFLHEFQLQYWLLAKQQLTFTP